MDKHECPVCGGDTSGIEVRRLHLNQGCCSTGCWCEWYDGRDFDPADEPVESLTAAGKSIDWTDVPF